LKWPRGENRGLQDRAGGLVGYPQPRDLLLGGQGQLLDGVHLPDLVGLPAAAVGGGRPPRRGRLHLVTAEPALQGARARQGLTAEELAQLYGKAPASPTGVFLMKL
jgi:hypothetical protein